MILFELDFCRLRCCRLQTHCCSHYSLPPPAAGCCYCRYYCRHRCFSLLFVSIHRQQYLPNYPLYRHCFGSPRHSLSRRFALLSSYRLVSICSFCVDRELAINQKSNARNMDNEAPQDDGDEGEEEHNHVADTQDRPVVLDTHNTDDGKETVEAVRQIDADWNWTSVALKWEEQTLAIDSLKRTRSTAKAHCVDGTNVHQPLSLALSD